MTRKPEPNEMEIWPGGRRVVVRFMFIDPLAATLMLNANTHNRVVNNQTRDGYASDMTENRWGFTGDAIQFGEDDLLLNGQHRLFAIEQSGVGQWMLVVEGLPNAVQIHMDTGLGRRAAHQYQLADDADGASQKASVASLMIKWKHWVGRRRDIKPTVPAVIHYARQHRERIERGLVVAREVHSGRVIDTKGKQRDGGVGGSVSLIALAALHVRANEVADADTVELFFHKLIFNERMESAGDPVKRLHHAFKYSKRAHIKNDLFRAAMGWNASMTGGALGSVQLPAHTKTVVSILRIPDLVGPEREDISLERIKALEAMERSGRTT